MISRKSNLKTVAVTSASGNAQPPAAPSRTPPSKPVRLLRLNTVVEATNLSRPTIYRLLAKQRDTGDALFPVPVRVSTNRIAWHEREIEQFVSTDLVTLEAALKLEDKPVRLIGLKEVAFRTTLSKPTIYRRLDDQLGLGPVLFPLPRRPSPKRITWLEAELDRWIADRPRVHAPTTADMAESE